MQHVTWRSMALVCCESALIVAAVLVSAQLLLGASTQALLHGRLIEQTLLIVVVCQLSLYFLDLYRPGGRLDTRQLLVGTLQALGAASLVLGVVYVCVPALIIGRGVFVTTALFVIVGVIGWRTAFQWVTARVGPSERILLVGTNDAAVRLSRELHERHDLGVRIVGFIDPDPAKVGTPVFNPGVIGTIEQIPAIVASHTIDRVVVCLADARGRLEMNQLLQMKLETGVNFDHLASVYEEYTGKIAVENLRPSWLIFSSGFRKSWRSQAIKRALDVIVALVAMVLCLPLMVVVAIAIKLTSRGPVFYQQERVGQHGKAFTIFKFRSMREDAETRTGAVWATQGDARVTAVGRLLRRFRLDELPQLWNVIRADMSLVGPRPERPVFVKQLIEQIPFYGQRHVAKPGLTGWAQVRYTYGATVEDAMEKLQYDLFYLKNMSLALDLYIMLKTAKTVLLGRGAC